jgi:DNA invertase Pin-like site-specific DNA recombinase
LSKSNEIRKLNNDGLSRSEIAKKLKIRYQFVRNVLVNEENKIRLLRLQELEQQEETTKE